MTDKVVQLKTKTPNQGSPWFMTDDLQVGRRLRFRSYRLKDEQVYTITKIMTKQWKVRKGGQAEMTTDRVRMSGLAGVIERGVMGLRISVSWELLDDH